VAISARHVHLTQSSIERLFGADYQLQVYAPLGQPGQFAAAETVTLIGARGRLAHVRIVGPPRKEDQSRSQAVMHSYWALMRRYVNPVICRVAQALSWKGGGSVTLDHGVICALRHIHMSRRPRIRWD